MIVYGKHPVREFLENCPDAVEKLWVDRADRLENHPDAKVVDSDKLDRLTNDGNHQGFALRTVEFQYSELSAIIDGDVVGILDQVQDPQNFGAIIRTAAAFNIPLVIPKDRSASVNDTVVRTSAGLVFKVPIVQVTNISRTLETLQESGFWSIGAAARGDHRIDSIKMDPKTVLVLGGEAGLRPLTEEKCDFRAAIPMAPGVESLNVSVSFAVFAYEFRRQVPLEAS